MEREVGGGIGIGMGNTCKPMAVSFQCMTKSTTIKKNNNNNNKKKTTAYPSFTKQNHLIRQEMTPALILQPVI